MTFRFRSAITSLPVITATALGVRLLFTLDFALQNTKQALSVIPFMFESGNIAYSLAQGHGFGSPFHVPTGPTAWMAPVYPYLLSWVFRIFGIYTFHSWIAAVLLNILFVTLACLPIYYAGKQIGGLALGAGAAWLWAIFPNAILLTFESMWDACLDALLAATILWATLKLEKSQRKRDWSAYGLLWGFTLMTNPTLASLLPLLAGWHVYRAHKQHRTWRAKTALTFGIAILCCVPWTIRNYRVFHAFVPVRTVLGLQLWLGNNPAARDIWLARLHPINDAAEREKYIHLGEIAYMREKGHEAIQYMISHPRRESYLIWKRFIATWSGGSPTPIKDLLRNASAWFGYVLVFNLVAALGALAGLVTLVRRRSAYAFPLAIFPLVYPWAYYLTLVAPRYRLPIDPIVLLLSAVAFMEIFRVGRFGASAVQPEGSGT